MLIFRQRLNGLLFGMIFADLSALKNCKIMAVNYSWETEGSLLIIAT